MKTPKMYAIARLVGLTGHPVIVRVPIVMRTVPEVPKAVVVRGLTALKINDVPLTYDVLDIQPVKATVIKK